jgi:hypothetical protein
MRFFLEYFRAWEQVGVDIKAVIRSATIASWPTTSCPARGAEAAWN